jgi:hypothetical protein
MIQTHKNPLEPSKKRLQSYGAIPQQGTLAELLWDFVGYFLQIDDIIRDIVFYWFADHILHPVREKAPFWGHC